MQLAIGIVKEATKALNALPTLILAPLVQVFALCLFMVPWIIYVVYLASSGEMVNHQSTYAYQGVTYTYTYRQYEYTENTKYAFLYMLFSYFWTSEFIVACGQLVIALAFADWYFTRDKSTIGNGSVLWVRALILYAAQHMIFPLSDVCDSRLVAVLIFHFWLL